MHIATNLYLAEFTAPRAAPEVLLGTMLPGLLERYRQNGGDVPPADLIEVEDYQVGMDLGRHIEVQLARNQALEGRRIRFAGRLQSLQVLTVPQVEACASGGLDMLLDSAVADWHDGRVSLEHFTVQVRTATAPLAEMGRFAVKEFVDDYFLEKRWRKYRVGVQVANLLRKQLETSTRPELGFDFYTMLELAQSFDDERVAMVRNGYRMLQPTRQSLMDDALPFRS